MLNKILQKKGTEPVAFDEICGLLSKVLECNVYVVSRKGNVIGHAFLDGFQWDIMKNKVLIDNQSIKSVSLEYGLTSDGMLNNWIKYYKENGYNIVEKKRGRSPTMKKEVKPIDPNDKDAIIKAKDEEILRLKAENEYLKKLRAVVQARKGQQPKTK